MTVKEIFIAILKRFFCIHKYKLESTTKFFSNVERKNIIVVSLSCIKCTKKKTIDTFNEIQKL